MKITDIIVVDDKGNEVPLRPLLSDEHKAKLDIALERLNKYVNQEDNNGTNPIPSTQEHAPQDN